MCRKPQATDVRPRLRCEPAPQMRPIKHDRREWILRKFQAFPALIIGEERKSTFAQAAKQHHADRWPSFRRCCGERDDVGINRGSAFCFLVPCEETVERICWHRDGRCIRLFVHDTGSVPDCYTSERNNCKKTGRDKNFL